MGYWGLWVMGYWLLGVMVVGLWIAVLAFVFIVGFNSWLIVAA